MSESDFRDVLAKVQECLDRIEGAAERLPGVGGQTVREALDDACEIIAKAVNG